MTTQSEYYEQCLDALFGMRRFGIKLELDTVLTMMERVGSPQRAFRSIHIAGTNGKGSIASNLSTILEKAGYKVGLYTSPHLVRFNERICIDNIPVSDEAVIEAYEVVSALPKPDREPTFFEFSTAMAFYIFGKRQVEWAVIETGMGGRMDATNVIHPEASVITNVSLEHQAYLGETLEEIAFEKAGIIKKGVPAVTGVTQPSALAVMQRAADAQAAPLYRLGTDFRAEPLPEGGFHYQGIRQNWTGMRTGLTGRFQIENAAITLAACEILTAKGIQLPLPDIRSGLAENRWPGRLEVISTSPYVLLDGAHNLAAAECLAEFLRSAMAGRKLTLVLGILDDKPYGDILGTLLPLANQVVLTSPKTYRALPAQTLFQAARQFHSDIRVIADIDSAVDEVMAHAGPDDVICIAGSLYMVADTKAHLEEKGYPSFRRKG